VAIIEFSAIESIKAWTSVLFKSCAVTVVIVAAVELELLLDELLSRMLLKLLLSRLLLLKLSELLLSKVATTSFSPKSSAEAEYALKTSKIISVYEKTKRSKLVFFIHHPPAQIFNFILL
jgi:hypothetical protein